MMFIYVKSTYSLCISVYRPKNLVTGPLKSTMFTDIFSIRCADNYFTLLFEERLCVSIDYLIIS